MHTLLTLNDDLLHTIFNHLINPIAVSKNKRASERGISRALPLASTCTRMMTVFSRTVTDLELWTTATITDDGLRFLCAQGGPYIKRLVLRGCNRLHASLLDIVGCQNIRTLDLSLISIVDDTMVKALCDGVGGTLESFLLRRCVRVTDEGIRAVGQKCTKLRALDAGGLIQLTDSGVEHLVRLRTDTLRILILSWCRALTDASLHMLAETKLQAVFLRGLHITDFGVEAMVRGIQSDLVALDVLDCPNISNQLFAQCLQGCAHLRKYLEFAKERNLFQNCVALLAGYVFVVGGVTQTGQESTLVCVVDAGSANAFAFHVLSGEAMTFDTDDVKVIASNSGVRLATGTREFLKRSFGIKV